MGTLADMFFSNQQVEQTSQLDKKGFFFGISVVAGYNYCHSASPSANEVDLVIDGVPAVLSEVTMGEPEPYWEMNVEHAGYCYNFGFSFNKADLQAVGAIEPVAVQVLSTFQFGSVP